jgi:HSP20 family protein
MKNVTKSENRPEVNRPSNEQAYRERDSLLPPVNIIENKEGFCLEAEMPGVNKQGLEVLLEGNELTLIGRRQPERLEADLLYRESSSQDFKRVFVLDPVVDTSKIDARMENGVLKLFLPKAESVKPRRISISD